VQLILDVSNTGRNAIRVESRRVSRKSRALRSFENVDDRDAKDAIVTWYAAFDARTAALRKKFANVLAPRGQRAKRP